MDKLIDCFESDFGSANEINDDWVASIFDNNFTDFENTSSILKPTFFDADDIVQREIFNKLWNKLIEFETQFDDNEIWNKLASNKIQIKRIIVLLWFAVEKALPKNSRQVIIETGIAAANIYLMLCSIRGAAAYNIFNQLFYERCFELFRQIKCAYMFGCRTTAQGKSMKTKGKNKKKTYNESDVQDMDEENIDKSAASALLDDMLKTFYIFFGKFDLGSYEQPMLLTVGMLRDICFNDKDCKNVNVAPISSLCDFNSLRTKTDKIIALFHKLAEDKHSNGGAIIHSRIVFPRLAFWGTDDAISSGTIPVSFVNWKDIIVRFVEERIKLNNDCELSVIFRVLENLYCRCTDRADYRLKVTGVIIDVLNLLPRKYQLDFAQRVDIFSKNVRGQLRSFTVEFIPAFLRHIDLNGEKPEKSLVDKTIKEEINESDYENNETTGRKKKIKKKKQSAEIVPEVEMPSSMYHTLIRYCLDKTSHIRARAVLHLAYMLQDCNHKDGIIKVANEMLDSDKWLYIISTHKKSRKRNTENVDGDFNEAEEDESELNSTNDTSTVVTNLIHHVFLKAAEDKTAQVRKAGVQAITSILLDVDSSNDFEVLFNTLEERCVDGSLLVRKQAAESLSSLLKPSLFLDHIENAWLNNVLPMMNDREQSVQQLASKLIYEYIIEPLIGHTQSLTWKLLNKIEQQDNHRRLLVRTLFYQQQDGTINDKIVAVIHRKLEENIQKNEVLWMILAELAVVFKVSPKLACSTWYRFENGEESNTVRYVAKVLSSSTNQLQPNEKDQLIDDIKKKISSFQIAAPHISSVYLVLAKLLDAIGEAAQGKQHLQTFGVIVIKACQNIIRKNITEYATRIEMQNGENLACMENRLIRVITTIGEIIQFSPSLISNCEKVVDALKTIMASELIQNVGEQEFHKVLNPAVPSAIQSRCTTQIGSRPGTAMNSECNIPPSVGPSQTGFSQPSSMNMQSQGTNNGPLIPSSYVGGQLFTSAVRSYCVLALGKFCLMDYKRAKECVPVFVNQLRINQDNVLKNNIMLVICDLCIRNTQLVDRYSPIIAACLKDKSTLVRYQTLESLTNLIKEQYIRWEGQIMYRFVSTILDEDETIRKYSEFCLKNVLLKQFPDMFYRHFLECLLYFNDISRSHITGGTDETDIDSPLRFSLSGEANRERRMKLYKFMLDTFDDKDKFTIMAHICEKALMPVALEELKYDDKNVKSFLRDSFEIMSSKEIRLSMDVGKSNEEDEEEPPAAVVAVARKMITEAYRKGIIQTIMPHLLDVRAYLMEKRSPLLKNCLIVLRNICIEHREQIEEVLGGDKQLQAEIEYDIKKFEEQQANELRLAKLAEKERRRSKRASEAATIILNGIITSGARGGKVVLQNGVNPIQYKLEDPMEPIKLQFEEIPNTACNLSVAEEEKKDDCNEVEFKHAIEPIQLDNGLPHKKAASVDAQKAPVRSIVHDENAEPNQSRHSVQNTFVNNDRLSTTFVAPTKKRSKEKTLSIDPNETVALPGRAISTPNKTIAEVTFSNLDLSAIRANDTAIQKSKSKRKLSTRRPSMAPISENQA